MHTQRPCPVKVEICLIKRLSKNLSFTAIHLKNILSEPEYLPKKLSYFLFVKNKDKQISLIH